MEKRKVIDKRQVKLEDLMKEGFIPFMEGRPKREKIINHDDILNLIISLNTADTVKELIEVV